VRLQSDIKVRVKNKIIGGPDVLICAPLLAARRSSLFKEADAIKRLAPDLLEWRIDGYDGVRDLNHSLDTLAQLRRQLGDTPLIFTCRTHSEGGRIKLAGDQRRHLITSAMASGNLDIVDIELCNPADFIQSIMETARVSGVRVILSHHDFETTPDETFILDTLFRARDLGANIAKVAVMPREHADVLTLMSATLKARQRGLGIPAITMSMGPRGRLSRLAGGLFGSDITFAAGTTPSAPGQIPIDFLRKGMTALYDESLWQGDASG
jgi:3-dehydroquinate dehydratase-1